MEREMVVEVQDPGAQIPAEKHLAETRVWQSEKAKTLKSESVATKWKHSVSGQGCLKPL